MNHKRKLSYRYRNRELQNTKIDVEKNHSRKLREKIRGRRNQTEIDLQVYQNKKNGVRFFWERRASERERESFIVERWFYWLREISRVWREKYKKTKMKKSFLRSLLSVCDYDTAFSLSLCLSNPFEFESPTASSSFSRFSFFK